MSFASDVRVDLTEPYLQDAPLEPTSSELTELQGADTYHDHSQLIKSAVHAITTNQDNVFKGFQHVVEDHHQTALKRKTLLRFVKYLVLLVVLVAITAIIDNNYVTNISISNFILGGLFVLAVAVNIFYLYVRCGKSRKLMNWKMHLASRYLPVCQVSQHYTKLMLPNLTTEIQRVCHCQLAGSSGDSFGFFPSYSANVSALNILTPAPFTQDVDMNLFYDALELSERSLIETGQPGFCWVQINETDIPQKSFIHDCAVRLPNMPGTYLSGKLVSDKIGSYIPTGADNIEYNYPAITYKTDIGGPQGRFNFDVDVVFGIKLNFWPSIAEDWPARVDRKLPADLLNSIKSQGCYIVHKHCNGASPTVDHQDHSLDWRITFAEAESKLFNYHSSKGAIKLCYIILKFIIKFYSSKKKKTFPALKSYHLKTVFLHFAEEGHQVYNLSDIKGNEDLNEIFHLLLERYINVLETKALPHYFMPSVNILGQYSDEEIQTGITMLKRIQGRPIWAVDTFDSAWINRKTFMIIILVLVTAAIISFGMYNYYYIKTITEEPDKGNLELVGNKTKDFMEMTKGPVI